MSWVRHLPQNMTESSSQNANPTESALINISQRLTQQEQTLPLLMEQLSASNQRYTQLEALVRQIHESLSQPHQPPPPVGPSAAVSEATGPPRSEEAPPMENSHFRVAPSPPSVTFGDRLLLRHYWILDVNNRSWTPTSWNDGKYPPPSCLHLSQCLHSITSPLVLGHSWLVRHNPTMDWKENKILGWSPECSLLCLRSASPTARDHPPPPLENIDLSTVPPVYHDLKQVFSKDRASSLPPHRPFDCAIDLLPGAPLPSSRLYHLSKPESESMEQYIQDCLAAGTIRPSSSPLGLHHFQPSGPP
ncbi:uncharacterized protein [Nothobranchius furzeri]|uniref:uncharacterized protein n=1 Tax=Nothobranchius furzeri TaxID=105023 RepID=UPI0024046304|nr:uncharacterized protein LOC129153640 [Nothobranchius furzeri]